MKHSSTFIALVVVLCSRCVASPGTCVLLPLTVTHTKYAHGLDASFEVVSATHGVCAPGGSVRVVDHPPSSCGVIQDTVWGADDDVVTNPSGYLALDIECGSVDYNSLIAHGSIVALQRVPSTRRALQASTTRPPDNFTSDTGQQCCCSAPPYPTCCCGPNRYACCVPFSAGPCSTLCKSLVVILSLMVVVVSMAAIITWRVYNRRRELLLAGNESGQQHHGVRQTPSAILRQLELCTVKGSTIATTTHAAIPVVDVHAETPPTTVAWDGPDMTTIPLDGDDDAQCGADDSACPVCLDAPAHGVDWRRFRCGHGVCFPCLKQMSMRLSSAQQALCPICRSPLISSFPLDQAGVAPPTENANTDIVVHSSGQEQAVVSSTTSSISTTPSTQPATQPAAQPDRS